jgi:hypothetical protein
MLQCWHVRSVGRSFLKGKKRGFGRGETVELYNCECELKIENSDGVPDYCSDTREGFLGLNQIYP